MLRSRLPALLLLLSCVALHAADTLNGYEVQLDSQDKLVSWVRPQSEAYDRVVRLAWSYLEQRVPVEQNGLKSFYTYCCLDTVKMKGTAWPHNPAGLYAMLADSAIAYYAYSGDRKPVELVRALLDYQIANGTTPTDWPWGGVPYASSDHGALHFRGAYEFQYDKERLGRGDGYGVIEPDKVGELGFGYLRFFELTGDPKYRDAAIACGNALARNIRQGDADKSPWPFRIYAETLHVREEYTANTIGPIRLLDELVRLQLGDAALYQTAREKAWQWLMKYPVTNNRWANYFEDIPIMPRIWNLNQYSPMETARYLIDHPEYDPDWRAHAAALLAFTEKTFAVDAAKDPGVQWGANAISEQLDYMPKMGSHTSRYASVAARFAELTGDSSSAEKAFRSLNWATYMCKESGEVNDQPHLDHAGIWFSDGYGDYIRHFLYALGAQPQWAPPGQSHIVRSSSVVTDVNYSPEAVSYRTFDKSSTEVIRLVFTPSNVTAGGETLPKRNDLSQAGWTHDSATKVLRVRHNNSGDIVISSK